MDDRRVGLLIRALRRRRGWRQADLARAAGISQAEVSRQERGHFVSVSIVRRVLAALDARLDLNVRWRGGELDRLVDEGHARLGTLVAAALRRVGWAVFPEVTFARFSERGSIDLLGINAAARAALMTELKTELTSYEEMQRRLDVKTRLAASVVEERFGWRPLHVGVVLVLADTTTNRDRAARVAPLLRSALPGGSLDLRRWLKRPDGPLRAVWFVRDIRPRTDKRVPGGSHRVRRPRSRSA